MSESPEFRRLSKFMKLIDKMVDDASKAQIAEAARLLALQIGHYQQIRHVANRRNDRAIACAGALERPGRLGS